MIHIARLAGLATIQDAGRAGNLFRGIPRSGAVDCAALRRANHAVGNAWDAAALELVGRITIATSAPCTIATDEGNAITLAQGEEQVVESNPDCRYRYIAVANGFDVPLWQHSRSTYLIAQKGGLGGRPLRRGDTLAKLSRAEEPRTPFVSLRSPPPRDPHVVRVVLGPDTFSSSCNGAFFGGRYERLATSNRTGVRLAGPPLEPPGGTLDASMPMVEGAIQVPPDGQPIVFGPEHPTVGGYPVIAVVVPDDLPRLHSSSALTPFRFVPVDAAAVEAELVRHT